MKRLLLGLLVLMVIAGLAAGSARAQGGGEGALTILMASPGEGESFYAAPNGFLLSMPVAGRVVSYDSHLDPSTVEVRLTFVDQTGAVQEIVTSIDGAGFFEVRASIQARGLPFPSDDPHDLEDCAICHHWSPDLQVPGQVTQLVVHATAEDGRTGHAVRRLRVDRGAYRDLTVTVEGLPEHAAGGQVSARTIIYEWRRRAVHGPISAGQVALQVERLAYADLTYAVSMDPLIVDSTRYTAEPTSVVISGGEETPVSVTLHARPELASLAGRVQADGLADGVAATVLAVDLLSGMAHTTMTAEDGTFVLEDLPVTEYALLARVPGGYHLPYHFDLTDTVSAEADIALTSAGEAVLNGVVTLEGALTAEVSAAGCYGVRLSTSDRDLGEIALTLHPDTRVVERGGSRLYLPAESSATDRAGIVTLTQGVLWVRHAAGSGASPLQIRVGSILLEGAEADFAVEKLTNTRARLYVSQGSVRVTGPDGDAPVEVVAGQTLALEGVSGQAVMLEAGVGPLLRSVAGPVARFTEAPTLAEKLSQAVYRVVVAGAQVMLVLAYAISVLLPVSIVVGLVVILFRRRKTAAGG
jgi:hypothetical protein